MTIPVTMTIRMAQVSDIPELAGHITAIYVRRDRIHQGIGSTLMQTLLDYAKTRRIERLYAEASEFSLGLFQKYGFHHMKQRLSSVRVWNLSVI